jgi:hypothetical protein
VTPPLEYIAAINDTASEFAPSKISYATIVKTPFSACQCFNFRSRHFKFAVKYDYEQAIVSGVISIQY